MRFYFAALVFAMTAGCASPPASTPAAPGVNLSGYPPAFRAGYADGCNSVNAAKKRDEPRFKSDADYARGWQDGYDICKHKKSR